MGIVRKREAAKRDLIEQFVWYAENASVEVADRFLQAADATLDRLAEAPQSGIPLLTPREELRGIRRWPVKGFEKMLLFYLPLSNGLDLLRVVHGSRDLARLFDEGFFSKSG
jgi:toxin ParE1/3/4